MSEPQLNFSIVKEAFSEYLRLHQGIEPMDARHEEWKKLYKFILDKMKAHAVKHS